MRNLLKLLYAYHFLLLFIALEIICAIFLFRYNNYHSASFASTSKALSGSLYKQVTDFEVYLSLRETNEALAKENARLRNYLKNNYNTFDTTRIHVRDSAFSQLYYYQEAKVVNNSVNKQYNYITLNKGSIHGIKPDMAVIGPNGIVGVVDGVSENFANVVSLLNIKFKVSAKLKKYNYLGSVIWEGKDYEYCTLNDIPQHVVLQKGDTIVTTGFSESFPEGEVIGTVEDFNMKDGNFYHIDVKISTVFKSLQYVSVIEDLKKSEEIQLEKQKEND
jgi:rod shape-determining protein MreC